MTSAKRVVDLRNLYIAVNVRINRESITRVINGKIVALCKHRGDNADKMFTLAHKPLQCYGYGLIRGIDAEKGCVYVATVEAPGDADTLLYADWAPEPPGATRLPTGTSVPYRAPHEAQLRQLMTAPRRRYNPIQLLKTSRIPKVKASS
uniref:NOL9 C-terminal domain-containing protein n=1 Tax=Picea sitchensis TaxID=3332 RepID=B8LPF5_PICSI|nr:unknown [Picea sitchensis]